MRQILMTLSCLLAAGAAHGAESAAVQRCIDLFQAEQNRIEREFRRTRPPETDRAAFEQWANNLHAALNAAGRAAEACERRSQPALTPERLTTLEACMAQVAAQSEALERRYAGRTLSREEQSQLRAERLALHEQRIACDLASRK